MKSRLIDSQPKMLPNNMRSFKPNIGEFYNLGCVQGQQMSTMTIEGKKVTGKLKMESLDIVI